MEFCDQSWNFINFTPESYQICLFFVDRRTFCKKVHIFWPFLKMSHMQNLSREMVMENREAVMEKEFAKSVGILALLNK